MGVLRRGIGCCDESGALLGAATARGLTLQELGDLYIEKVLEQTGGNKVQAAKRLGINRRTLYRRGDRKRDRDSSDPDREHDSED